MINIKKIKVGDKLVSTSTKAKVEIVNIIDIFVFVKDVNVNKDEVFNIPSSDFDDWFKFGKR